MCMKVYRLSGGWPHLKNSRRMVNSETLNCETSCRDGYGPISSGPTDRRAMKVTLVVAYSRSPEHERAATKWARDRFCS